MLTRRIFVANDEVSTWAKDCGVKPHTSSMAYGRLG